MTDLNDDVRKLVTAAIVASPYARLLGIEAEELAVDSVRLRLSYRPGVTTFGDTIHGGAISSLVDIAATGACWASHQLPPGSRGTTIGFSINFLAAGRGQDLVATARVIQRGRSLCVCEVDVHGKDGAAVARATVTYKLSGKPV